LRESEERYRTLFENASDIIYTHDLAGNFISVNHACERVTGHTREDLLRSTFHEIIAPDQRQRAREMIQHKLNRGGPVTCELDLIAKEGHRVTVEVNARMIYQGGQPVGVQGIARDITERRRLEQERARHTRELAARVLRAQEEERKRIARELHDETAQSLSVLLVSLDLLEQYIPENEGQLRAGVERVHTLARRVLDETRTLSHDLRPTILDDAGLIAALEWLATEYEVTYGGSVHVHAESEPAEYLSAEVEVALFRIAQEALSNSGKHAEAHTVQVSLSFPDSIVKLAVQDDGRGFDLERVPGPTREGRLGLYGMRERANLLGGTLRIAADSGQGTRIVAEIPLTENRDAKEAQRYQPRSRVEA
jgi:PAS domain S-box-containing protein